MASLQIVTLAAMPGDSAENRVFRLRRSSRASPSHGSRKSGGAASSTASCATGSDCENEKKEFNVPSAGSELNLRSPAGGTPHETRDRFTGDGGTDIGATR